MKYFLWFILIFIMTLETAQAQTTPREYFRVAKYKMDRGDYQSALDFINSAIISDTTYMNAYLLRSEINFHLGYYASTIKDIDKAFKLNPKKSNYLSKYYLLRGQAYGMNKDYEAAIKDIDRTLSIEDKNPVAYYERAKLNILAGRYRDALKDMNKAIELHSDQAAYYAERAKIKQSLYKPLPGTAGFESMLSDINVAIALDDSNYSYHKFHLRLIKEEKKDAKILLDEVNEIISKFPDQPEMFVERGVIFMNKYKYKEAISDFTHTIELDDKLEDAYRYRGLCYHNINKTDKAIRDFSVSIKILEKLMLTEKTNSAKYENTLAKTYIHRGYSYQMSGYNQEACRDFLRAYNLGSKTGFNYYRKFCRGF